MSMKELVEAAARKEGCAICDLKVLVLDSQCTSAKLEGLDTCTSLEELSLNKCGIKSLEGFPTLPFLKVLKLSDNLIADGLDALEHAELQALQELDLSGNKIATLEELEPLAALPKLSILDLFQCPVEKVKDYASSVFGIIEHLNFLNNLDADGQERDFESDAGEDDDEDGSEGSEDDSGDENALAPTIGHVVNSDDESDGSDDDQEGLEPNAAAGPGFLEGGTDDDESDGEEPEELGTEVLLQAPTAEESDDGSFDEDGEDQEEDVDEEDDEEEEAEEEAGPSKRPRV